MTEGKYNFWGSAIVGITAAFGWAYSVKVWLAWIVPIALCGLALWFLVKQERGLREAGKEIRATVQDRSKRKAFRQVLVHVAGRAALIVVVIVFVFRMFVQYVEASFSWHARDFWRAQCIGMKTVEITGVPAEDFLNNAPILRTYRRDIQLDYRRQAVIELQNKGIIRRDVPPATHETGVVTQNNIVTPFGRMVCSYYFTAYKLHKKAE